MLTELKYAFRSLRQAPWFSALVASTLALGIGATTAITSVVNTVLLSPLPYRDADRLVTIFQQAPGSGVAEDSMSPPQFHDILEQSNAFEELGMMVTSPVMLNHILALVLRHGTVVAAIGVGAGAVVALAASRFVQSLLYRVGATDPITYLAIGLLLSTVALVACWIPAQRASRFHPLDAMRLD